MDRITAKALTVRGRRVQEAMAFAQISSVTELARRSGAARRSVYRLMTENTRVDAGVLLRVCEALQVPPSWIFNGGPLIEDAFTPDFISAPEPMAEPPACDAVDLDDRPYDGDTASKWDRCAWRPTFLPRRAKGVSR